MLPSFSATGGISSIPTKTCTEKSGRRKTMVTPSTASSTNRTTAAPAVRRSLPSAPPLGSGGLGTSAGCGGRGSRRTEVSTPEVFGRADESPMRAAFIALSDARSHNGLVRVLVVEDETKLGKLLSRGLREEGYSPDLAERGEEALWMAKAVEYDAIVLDVMLPGLDGFAVCRRLRADGVWSPVLMLTARDAVDDRITGLDAGADDYLAKPFSFEELLARLRALTRRAPVERPAVLTAGSLRLDPAAHRAWRGDVELDLSAKEFALLELFMRRPGSVLSRGQLLEGAWDMAFESRSNVVDVYVRYLREKIDRPFGCSSIETVRGVGYRLAETEAE